MNRPWFDKVFKIMRSKESGYIVVVVESEPKGDNLNIVRCESSRTFRNRKGNI
jgi:hypothetical protein